MRIEVVRGDITTQAVDAIVNAANRELRRGAGVCRGPSGTLGHPRVGPIYHAHDHPEQALAACHTASLRVADEVGARSVAFPAISCGIFGYPVDEAAPIAVAAVRGAQTAVELVRFVLFDEGTYDAFAAASRA